MDSEERPTKMRKLDNGAESADAAFTDSAPANNGNTQDSAPVEVNQPTEDVSMKDQEAGEPKQDGESQTPTEEVKISKNQLKKLRRHEKWESGREDRKEKRKLKIKEKKQRRREEWAETTQAEEGEAADGTGKPIHQRGPPRKTQEPGVKVPITVIFDCDFEELMFDNEMKSLGLQITRCYSDNRKSKYQAHLAVSSFGGKMKERFDGILAKQYEHWKGVRFFSEDFVEVAAKSKEWMKEKEGGKIVGAIAEGVEDDDGEGEVVYLSSESDVTLDRLKPNSTYIIGGLVDKNRYKGICYKRAVERGIKTAKLPIGEFLHMKSRQVLVTNHVLEIMLRWMECGDWGQAFMDVLPKRKGAVLQENGAEGSVQDEDATPDADDTPVVETEKKNVTSVESEAAQATKPKGIEASSIATESEAIKADDV